MLKVSLVGTGGMAPLPNRFLSSLILSCEGSMVLVDCGEGTQVSLKSLGWGLKNIDIICFTHFHADHIAGLPGLLSTIGNSGRTSPLTIVGPKHLKLIVESLNIIVPMLPFEINYIEMDDNEVIEYEHKNYVIRNTWVEHHIPCIGYSFEVKRNPRFDKEKAINNNVPMKLWNKLQKEGNVVYENKHYTQDMVLGIQRKGLKVSYCTDSRPVSNLIDFIYQSDLFVCEGMYGDDKYKIKAQEKKHMLFSEAAELAKQGKVKELWLTHFSPSLITPDQYCNFATSIFPNSIVGYDRMLKEFKFED